MGISPQISRKIWKIFFIFQCIAGIPKSWGGASVNAVPSYSSGASYQSSGGSGSSSSFSSEPSPSSPPKKKFLKEIKDLIEDNPVDTSVGAAGLAAAGTGLLTAGAAVGTAVAPIAKSIFDEVLMYHKRDFLNSHVEEPLREAALKRKKDREKLQARMEAASLDPQGVEAKILDHEAALKELTNLGWKGRANRIFESHQNRQKIEKEKETLQLQIAHGEMIPALRNQIKTLEGEINLKEKRTKKRGKKSKGGSEKKEESQKPPAKKKSDSLKQTKLKEYKAALDLHEKFVKDGILPNTGGDGHALFNSRHQRLERTLFPRRRY